MSNLPDKQRTSELTGARRTIEAALAATPQSTGKPSVQAALAATPQRMSKQPMQAPAPEILELHCVCAVHDKPYVLRFRRQTDRSLHLLESVKVQPAKGTPSGEALAGGTVAVKLSVNDIGEDTPLPCAWCGNDGLNHCQKHCNALVCGGLTVGNVFHCRKSCGASWSGVPMQELPGQAKAKPHTPPMRPAPSPSPEKLRLPPGSSLVKNSGK